MKQVFLLFGLLLIFACSKSLIAPAQADVNRVFAKFPGYTMADLEAGKAVYEDKCNMCHGLKDPTNYTEEELNKIVPSMVRRVNKKVGSIAIDPAKESLVLKYMVTMGPAKAVK